MRSSLIFASKRRFCVSSFKKAACVRLYTTSSRGFTAGTSLTVPRLEESCDKHAHYGNQGFVCNSVLVRKFSKEITVSSTKPEQDLLMSSLISASSVSDVLNTVEMHHSIMNNKHLIQALVSLFELLKSDSSYAHKDKVVNSPQFTTLCKKIKAKARGLELQDTVQALKVVCYLGIPSTSIITQVLLQLIRHGVNDLSLSQIVFLNFLLQKMQPTPLRDALTIALPLVFEAQLPVKLDRSSVTHLTEMLQYASKKSVSNRCRETIVHSLTILVTNKREELDPRTAKSIVWSLSNSFTVANATDLLQKSLTVMSDAIDHYTFSDIENILLKIVRKIVNKKMEFYHENFIDSCVSYIIRKDDGAEKGIWTLRKLTRIAHTSIELMNYICEKIILEPRILQDCKPHILFSLVTGLSNADYKPPNWEIIKNIILNHPLLEEGKMELPWIKFAGELAALGCYSPYLLEKIFQEDFLNVFLSRENNVLDQLQLLVLYQAVVTLYPTYTGPLPPKDRIEKAAAINGEIFEEFPLESALMKGLGGPSYLHTKVYTKLGHFIDHVIIMRKGGFPVSLSPRTDNKESRLFVEDIDVPVDSQIVAVLGFHPGCYSVNCSRLRGNFSLVIRTLESLNLAVIPVSLKMWSSLPEQERIPYLMQEIKIKCSEKSNISVA